MDNIPILVMTSDKYMHALRPFAYLFNKYWSGGHPVIIGGFTRPTFDLPSNFYFESIGKFEDYPVNRWSDSLIDLLSKHTVMDAFVLMLEDYWITRPVNQDAVRKLYNYARQFNYVLKIDLCGDRLYAAGAKPYGHCDYIDLVISDPDSQYHMSLMTGVWNRELMLKFLVRGETPWQVEIDGTPRVREAGSDVVVLGTRVWPIRHTLAFRSGDPSEFMLDELCENDVAYLREQGWLSPIGSPSAHS